MELRCRGGDPLKFPPAVRGDPPSTARRMDSLVKAINMASARWRWWWPATYLLPYMLQLARGQMNSRRVYPRLAPHSTTCQNRRSRGRDTRSLFTTKFSTRYVSGKPSLVSCSALKHVNVSLRALLLCMYILYLVYGHMHTTE